MKYWMLDENKTSKGNGVDIILILDRLIKKDEAVENYLVLELKLLKHRRPENMKVGDFLNQ